MPSDPIAAELDQLQTELNEGPALSVLRERHTVLIKDLSEETRWPNFVEDISRNSGPLWAAQESTRKVESWKGARTPSKFEFHLWDLGAVAAAIQQSSDVADSVKSTARDALVALQPGAGAVLAEGHQGAWFDGTRGGFDLSARRSAHLSVVPQTRVRQRVSHPPGAERRSAGR